MKSQENIEMQLWDYIDGFSTVDEKSRIEKLLESNAEWQAKYRELLDVHRLMKSTELDEPSMRFTKNVMDEIARLHIAPAAKKYINNNIVRGLGIFFITLIVGFLVYGIIQTDWKTSNGESVMPFNLNKIDYSKIDFSKFFNNTYLNVFMMINVILGLFLFDRFLANKRKKMREH
jgi:hypothetical protein